MPSRDYPATVAEVLDPAMKFGRAALAAVRAFARAKPYRADTERKERLVLALNRTLALVYGIRPPTVAMHWDRTGRRRSRRNRSLYRPAFHLIELHGPFSVVTFLHEFAHARGMGERAACRWSINLFAKCFPRSFARCRHDRHVLRAGRS